jgi:hypothetical protein
MFCLAAALGLHALPAAAAIVVSGPDTIVAAGSSIQVPLTVSNTTPADSSDIQGLVLTVKIDAGAAATPFITNIDLLTNTVWSGHVGPATIATPPGGNLPQYQSRDLLTNLGGEFINANGLLATVTIDTVGAPLGLSWLSFADPLHPGRDSLFLNGLGEALPSQFSPLSLTIALAGDATLDNKVDAFDLNLLASHWQQQQNATWSSADFTHDGKVDAFDLNLLAAHWQFGVTLTPSLSTQNSGLITQDFASVPEPTSFLLLFPALLPYRRRPHR